MNKGPILGGILLSLTVAFADSVTQAGNVTYRNSDLGYEFTIPDGFEVEQGLGCDLEKSDCTQQIHSSNDNGSPPIYISAWRRGRYHPDCKTELTYDLQPETVTGDEIVFQKFKVTDSATRHQWPEVWYITNQDDLCYAIKMNTDWNYSETEPYQTLVLSFRFIKGSRAVSPPNKSLKPTNPAQGDR